MDELITEYATYGTFIRDWEDSTENELRMLWQLLGELEDDEVLIRLPKWLAEENVGFVDGAAPTTFVGRLDRETEKAVRLVDSAAAEPLMKHAHRIHHIENGLETIDHTDTQRREWLEERLRKTRREFELRDDITSLSTEWLPKSQLLATARRIG